MIPTEIVFEIYSYLGNTDKRRLRQTSTKYHIKFKEKDLIEELIEDGYPILEKYNNHTHVNLIVKYGRLDLLRCSKVKINRDLCYLHYCKVAANYGQLEMLIYTHEYGCEWDEWTCMYAATNLTCLKYLHEHGCPWHEDTCKRAAEGHIECLKYAHENGCPWKENTCSNAAKGYMDCLIYAYENGCPWDSWACANAAQGHLDCLKYLHEHGCPWDIKTCSYAARGHLECLKYAIAHGCPWYKNTCIDVAHLDCLNYIDSLNEK